MRNWIIQRREDWIERVRKKDPGAHIDSTGAHLYAFYEGTNKILGVYSIIRGSGWIED